MNTITEVKFSENDSEGIYQINKTEWFLTIELFKFEGKVIPNEIDKSKKAHIIYSNDAGLIIERMKDDERELLMFYRITEKQKLREKKEIEFRELPQRKKPLVQKVRIFFNKKKEQIRGEKNR